MTSAQFELLQVEAAPQPVIELRGEIDATNAADFDREICAKTASGPAILDLSPAAYLDSAGFEVLDRLLATGSLIVVISTTSVLHKAASLMSVPFHDTVDQARSALPSNR
jgi:anti-anti-sigma factor